MPSPPAERAGPEPALADLAARVDAQHDWFTVEVGEPAGEGWVWGPDWVAGGGELLDAQVDEIAAARQGGRDLGAVFLAGWYGRAVAFPVVGAWALTGCVVELSLDRLRVHRAPGGWFDRFALSPSTPVVPASAPAGERRAAVGRVVVDHAEPVVERLHQLAPVGRRALWAGVTDAMGSAVLASAATLGDEAGTAARADAAFAAAPAQLDPRPTWVWVEVEGRSRLAMRRAACCLAYKSPLHGLCATCPLLSEEDRVEALRASMAAG